MIYYVYAYLDPRKEYKDISIFSNIITHEPFYIGRGKNNRLYDHLLEAKKVNELDKNIIKQKNLTF